MADQGENKEQPELNLDKVLGKHKLIAKLIELSFYDDICSDMIAANEFFFLQFETGFQK